MSDRPTISIYSNGRIQEWYYLRNWPFDSVLLECVDLVKQIGSATERGEVLARLGEDPNQEYDEEGLLFLEGCSEFDAVIDLTGRVVFYKWADETLDEAESSRRPIASPGDYDEAYRLHGPWAGGDLISFDVLDHVRERLEGEVPDGREEAEEVNLFIDEVLPGIITDAFGCDPER